MVAKIDPRMSPERFLSFKQEVVNKQNRTQGGAANNRTPQVQWELRGFKRTEAGNVFLSVNPLAVCVQETFKYLEENMGMRNAPLTHFVVPLSRGDAEKNLPKLVDKHNGFLEHFGLAVAAYWQAKAQQMLRLDPTRKVMERTLDMRIEANEVANFREITHSCLNVTGWNPTTKLLTGGDIELLYPNAEGMLSLGRAREVVVDLKNDSPDDSPDDEPDDSADEEPGAIYAVADVAGAVDFRSENSVAVGMWGAL